MNKWLKENCLDIIIIAAMFGIMLAIYAGYKFFAEPETRTVTTVSRCQLVIRLLEAMEAVRVMRRET